MKLALGTVQMGIPYGVNNRSGVPSDQEISNIFTIARQHGINYLDTASAYGASESKIGLHAGPEFNVVSKFSGVSNSKELVSLLDNSLAHLNVESVYGYLAHNGDSLIKDPAFWNTLQSLKDRGKIHKIGYSLYTPDQLEKLLELDLIPDLVQLPYSLLDRKFERYFPLLKSLNTEIHVRSVFLQGLYITDLDALPSSLSSLKPSLRKVRELCREHDISIISLALNFAVKDPAIDQVVIGVETAFQLAQNIAMLTIKEKLQDIIVKVRSIEVTDPELLNPANW